MWRGSLVVTKVSEIEELRLRFRPKPIATLFIGESPPHGGTFFYSGDSHLYRNLQKAFKAGPNFLLEFEAKCFFLDDLVQYPINQMEKREKLVHRMKSVPLLAERIQGYQPKAVVALMVAIAPMVRRAMDLACLSRNVPLYVTAFPSRYHTNRFQTEMAEIIPKLPMCP